MAFNPEAPEEEMVGMGELPAPIDLINEPDMERYAEKNYLAPLAEQDISIDEELRQQLVNDLENEKNRAEMALSELGGVLERKFKEFSTRRHLKELEWINAILQHSGRPYSYNSTKKQFVFGDADFESKPVVNITRQKVNLAVARMRDIQFPLGGDHNFRIMPHYEVEVQLAQASQNPQEQMAAQNVKALQYESARKMEETIVGQLIRSQYGNKARESMRDWVLLGTGIMKGPVVDVDRRKLYEMLDTTDGGMVADLQYLDEEFPNAFRVDPKYFFPDPDTLISDDLCEAIEVHPLTKSKLIELKHNPAFLRKKLEEAVESEPEGITGIGNLNELAFLTTDADLKNRYIVKEYHGPIPKEFLLDLGIINEEDYADPLIEHYGEVWFVKGTVIRVSLSPIEGYNRIPYHLVPWETDDGSIFGHGMAWMMRDAQRVAKSGWQMLLDNAGLSSGPQMVIHREMIQPADGNWEIAPHKLWFLTEYGQNVQEAFQFFNVPNNQQQIASVVEMAMNFGDLESESPMIMQNLIPQANNTASGQAMMLTIGNVTQRDKSQLWDDYVTRPLIEGYYHWNMQYNDDPGIKGNFEIELAGATEAIDAQMKSQEIERILALAMQNPEYMLHIDANEAFREIVAASRVGKRIIRSQEEAEAQAQQMAQQAQQQGPDPDSMRAEAALVREQIRQQEMQMEAQYKQAEMQLKQQLAQMEYERSMAESQAKMVEVANNREMQLLKMAVENETTMQKLMQDFDLKTTEQLMKLAIEESKQEQQEKELEIKRQTGTGI
jgi:hypothetical protein